MPSILTIFVCAWCHCLIGNDGQPLVRIEDMDYPKYENHGICNICKKEMMESVKKPE